MCFICQTVPDRDACVARQFFHVILCKAAILNPIVQASKDTSRIFNRLSRTEMGTRGTHVRHICALIGCGNFKTAACARRVLLKNEGNLFTFQPGYFCASMLCRLQFSRKLEEEADLLGLKIIKFEKMPTLQVECHAFHSFAVRSDELFVLLFRWVRRYTIEKRPGTARLGGQ